MPVKSLFASKTFWVNLLALVLTVADVLPAKYSVPVITVANVVLRYLTTSQVSVTGK